MFAHAYFTCTILGPAAAVLVIFRNIHVEARVQHGRIAALGSHHPLETPKVLIQKMLVPVRLFVRPMHAGVWRRHQTRPVFAATSCCCGGQSGPRHGPDRAHQQPRKVTGESGRPGVCVCSDHRHAAHSDFMDNPQILQSILLDTLRILALLHVFTLTTSENIICCINN